MSEEKDPSVSMIELQEEFVQHYESGGKKVRFLALVATVAGGYFALVYFLQLVILPFALGIRSQTVDLVDPSLMALEAVGFAVALLWCLAGIRDLAFAGRLAWQVMDLRALQAQVAEKYGLDKQP